jgi:NADPH2:quinone reductase
LGGDWILGERPVPAVKAREVLVRVKVAALKPIDYKLPRMVAGAVPGLDVAGVVEAVRAGVSDFSVGDEVSGKGRGTIAELCSTSAKNLTKKPLEMPW